MVWKWCFDWHVPAPRSGFYAFYEDTYLVCLSSPGSYELVRSHMIIIIVLELMTNECWTQKCIFWQYNIDRFWLKNTYFLIGSTSAIGRHMLCILSMKWPSDEPWSGHWSASFRSPRPAAGSATPSYSTSGWHVKFRLKIECTDESLLVQRSFNAVSKHFWVNLFPFESFWVDLFLRATFSFGYQLSGHTFLSELRPLTLKIAWICLCLISKLSLPPP